MPTFYDKFFKPSKTKGIIRSKRSEWYSDEQINELQEPIKLKDAEDYIIRQMFKTKKKSLANQKVDKKA
tara:strand:- start:447 stop:653 length:207 start_codon:yes stop_codon:yes gene_type:complete